VGDDAEERRFEPPRSAFDQSPTFQLGDALVDGRLRGRNAIDEFVPLCGFVEEGRQQVPASV
jgi:hypothetical protein